MRKRCFMLLLTLSVLGLSKTIAQNYKIQIAAFSSEIDRSFFDFAGFPDIHQKKGPGNFVKYSTGSVYSHAEAEKVRQKAKEQGFMNTQIISEKHPTYARQHDSPNASLTINIPAKDPLYIRSAQFEKEQLSFKGDLSGMMREVFQIMFKHPELKLRIIGHAVNTNGADNKERSRQRARMVRNYLLAHGIPAYRLKTKVREGADFSSDNNSNQRIMLALVDLKEEIVTDRFNEPVIAKEEYLSSIQKISDLLSFVKLV